MNISYPSCPQCGSPDHLLCGTINGWDIQPDPRDARIAELERKLVARTKTITQLQAELARAREAVRDADQYLSSNELNSIGAGSQLHRQFKAALALTAEMGKAE
jgi:uncharacterized coiled-coil protein SlyX